MDMNDHVISKADLWADRIHAFQESGLSRKDWCQQNEIPQSTLNLTPGQGIVLLRSFFQKISRLGLALTVQPGC